MGIILDNDSIELKDVIGIKFGAAGAGCVLYWVDKDANDRQTDAPFTTALAIAHALGWVSQYDINAISYHVEYSLGEVTLNAEGYTLSD